ncbi:hypothetical protein ZWY2020_037462 [Hordeum vulgare]|nr:hypothetical protein ZWY2020_037462 [Hordeum vulgare]
MDFRRAIVSLAVHSQASYCLHRAAASPPTLKPPPPPPPTLSCPVIVPCCSFVAPPHHVNEVFKDNEDDAGPDSTMTSPLYSLGSSPMKGMMLSPGTRRFR